MTLSASMSCKCLHIQKISMDALNWNSRKFSNKTF